jgi:hypothetical protein
MNLMPKNCAVMHWLILPALILAGCGGATPVAGGTTGVLHAGDELLGDIQITVHAKDGTVWKPLGFGVTAFDGSFELVTSGAKGPLWLSPGEYRCTLESAGAPVAIPAELSQAETTPLKITRTAETAALDLRAPTLLSQK